MVCMHEVKCVYGVQNSGNPAQASTQQDQMTPLHHLTTMPTGGRQEVELVVTVLAVEEATTGEAPTINQPNQDCVDSVTLAIHVS